MFNLLLLLAGLLVYYILNFYKKVRQYPKGPTPLPFIGNLHQIDFKNAHVQFAELSKKYGSVYTLWLPRPFVIVADYDNIKEAFSKSDDFSGRTGVFPDTSFMLEPNSGIVFSEGENWKEQRRFSLQVLRDFGMGKAQMEEMVLGSAQNLLDHLKTLDTANGVELRWPLQLFVGNIITNVLFNFMFPYNSCKPLQEFVHSGEEAMLVAKEIHPIAMLIAQNYPFFLDLPIIGTFVTGKLKSLAGKNHSIIRSFIERCRAGFNPQEDPECFVHAYTKKLGSNEYLTESQLQHVCADFYGAGQETTTTTLKWAMLYLAQFQDVQDKMREEISKVVGFGRMPSTSDKQRLPYVTAAINEIQRKANLVPLNLTHKTTKDTEVGGHAIPGDTFVISLLSNVLHNSYEEGDKFLPERFLMEDGVTPNKEAVDRNIVFSIGKRICAGEGLARVELFLGLVTILQHYKILPMPGTQVDLSPIISFVMLPKNQKLRLVPLDSN